MSALQARATRVDPVRLVRLYMFVLGGGLLLEGATLLLVDRLGLQLAVGTNDVRHNLLHVVWGIALLVVAVLSHGRRAAWSVWAALIFGAFYIALGVLGLTVDRPFGLLLGPGENAFHFTVGPLALLLGAWALRSTMTRPSAVRAVLPVPTAAPLRRRRPSERKRVSRRGTARRH